MHNFEANSVVPTILTGEVQILLRSAILYLRSGPRSSDLSQIYHFWLRYSKSPLLDWTNHRVYADNLLRQNDRSDVKNDRWLRSEPRGNKMVGTTESASKFNMDLIYDLKIMILKISLWNDRSESEMATPTKIWTSESKMVVTIESASKFYMEMTFWWKFQKISWFCTPWSDLVL